MRVSFFLTVASLFTVGFSAVAQGSFATSQLYASAGPGKPTASLIKTAAPAAGKAVPAASGDNMVLTGKITNPAGALPGAVVIISATKQMAVTNAEGEFEFVVPAGAGELAAVVTYAGYADEALTLNTGASESTATLSHARVIVVSRKQQLKKYLKTARKQVKRDLRRLR